MTAGSQSQSKSLRFCDWLKAHWISCLFCNVAIFVLVSLLIMKYNPDNVDGEVRAASVQWLEPSTSNSGSWASDSACESESDGQCDAGTYCPVNTDLDDCRTESACAFSWAGGKCVSNVSCDVINTTMMMMQPC